MMTNSAAEANDERRFRQSLIIAAGFVAVLWLIQLDAAVFDLDLSHLGIYPHRISGLLGIAFAPLIHGSFLHLLANSVPIVVIGTALLYGYPRSAGLVLASLYAGTGLGVWLFAREAYHIGASGLTSGMMFFVFTIGALRWDRRAIALSSAGVLSLRRDDLGNLPGRSRGLVRVSLLRCIARRGPGDRLPEPRPGTAGEPIQLGSRGSDAIRGTGRRVRARRQRAHTAPLMVRVQAGYGASSKRFPHRAKRSSRISARCRRVRCVPVAGVNLSNT
ncbi:MAG: rhomboid family intramembrane serine protease [Desulfobacterales bacterium]|nr:rhomboid family intramembrane serine protease [Desulfobacterales bacterium]